MEEIELVYGATEPPAQGRTHNLKF